MSSVIERFTMKASDFEIVIAKHGTHDQSSHGNWANGGVGAGVAQSVLDRVAENGGLSVKLVDGSEPKGGYMVATDSKYGSVASASDFYDPTKGPKILADYLKKHKTTLGNANNYLGLWHNKDDGNVYLDVSENIQDKDTAISAGAKRDQISIWDVANFAEIQTGGTGVTKQEDGSNRDSEEHFGDDGRGNRSLRSNNLGEVGQTKVIHFAPGLKPILKHLPGQHDQASHGAWSSGRWQEAQNIKDQMALGVWMDGQALTDVLTSDQMNPPYGDLEDLSKAMFEIVHEGKDRSTGKPVKLTSVVESAELNSNGNLEITGEVQDQQGYHVGEFGRTLFMVNGELAMSNDILSLDEEYTGTGFGTEFLNHAENYAYALGIKNQYVHAVALADPAMAGPFVWAKRGYAWDTTNMSRSTSSQANVLYHIKRVLNQSNPDPFTEDALINIETRMQTLSVKHPDYPTPHEIAYTGWKSGATNWAGLDVMGNSDWSGIRPVGPSNSESLPNGGRLSP